MTKDLKFKINKAEVNTKAETFSHLKKVSIFAFSNY